MRDDPRLGSSSTVIKRTLVHIGHCNSTILYAVFKAMDKSDPPTSAGSNVRVNKEMWGGEADIFTPAGSAHRAS